MSNTKSSVGFVSVQQLRVVGEAASVSVLTQALFELFAGRVLQL